MYQDDFSKQLDIDHKKGFDLIKKFVENYDKSEYPSIDDNLIEMFVRGSRLMGINHIILPEDDSSCPECGFVNGKVGKKGLSLHTSFGNSTLCHYCSYFLGQKNILKHNASNCKHPSSRLDPKKNPQWTRYDCEAVWESYEYSYKAILKELFND